MAYFPGIAVGTDAEIKRINFPMVFMVTGCMAIGSVANVLGVGKILANVLLPFMSAAGSTVTLVLVWLLCVIANFLMTPLAIMSSLSVPLTQVALQLGISPLAFYYTLFHSVDQIILPYEYVLMLLYYAFGLISIKDFAKFFGVKMVLNLLFLVAILFSYWRLIGLI